MSSPDGLDLLLQSAEVRRIADLARAAGLVGLSQDQSRFTVALVHRMEALGARLLPAERALVREVLWAEIGLCRRVCATLATEPEGADELLQRFRAARDQELIRCVEAWIALVGRALVPSGEGEAEAEVEYLTWYGDLKAILAPHEPDGGHDGDALRTYEQALVLAHRALPPTNPIRLRLVHNYAELLWESGKDREKALTLLNQAFDDAVARLDRLQGAAYDETSALLTLCAERREAWKGEASGAG